MLKSEADIEPDELVELGETLGDDPQPEKPAEPVPPRPAAPTPLAAGVGPGAAPGGAAAPGGGGGGGGGGNVTAATAAHMLTSTAAPSTSSFNPNLIANDDYFALAHDTFQSGTVTDNDVGAGTVVQDSSPTNGLLQLDSGGSFTYQPNTHFVGADSFTYHLVDVFGDYSNTATVTFDVQEHAPVAVNDSYTLQHDRPFIVTSISNGVLGNDSDQDQSDLNLTASLVTGPTNGQLQLNSDGTFIYTPIAGYVGADSFTYNAVDTLGETSMAVAMLNIVNQKPIAKNDGVDDNGNVIWQVGWRKTDAIQSSLDQNVILNDSDPDNDPITPSIDTFPGAGTLEFVKNANGFWTGEFIYTPNVGASGIDSFQYHVFDGAASSLKATVKIRIEKVDLDMWDGGDHGVQMPDALELSRGVYAVTNFNDTNGDATADLNQNPVNATLKGKDEYDLMRLVVNPPFPVLSGLDNVTLNLTPGLDLWADPTKTASYAHTGDPDLGEEAIIPISRLPATVYVEAVYVSNSLRDMGVQATYAGVTDLTHVTGIWVGKTGEVVARQSADQIKQSFRDIDTNLYNDLVDKGGTGLIPTNATPGKYGTKNGIVLQFTVYPLRGNDPHTWEQDFIHFDITRRLKERMYNQTVPNGAWTQSSETPASALEFPMMVEDSNDDLFDTDESPAVTPDGHIYVVDFPGIRNYQNQLNYNAVVIEQNFQEFVRAEIDFAQRASGNGWIGSRASDYVPWSSAVSTIADMNNNNWLFRNDADTNHNLIRSGTPIILGPPQ